jgi:hypothetical protein
MAIELECGSCGRRIHVEASEGVVVCPHCRTALQVPEPGDFNSRQPDAGDAKTMPVVTAAESATDVESESPSQFAFLELEQHEPAAVPDSKVFPGFPIGVDDLPDSDSPTTQDNPSWPQVVQESPAATTSVEPAVSSSPTATANVTQAGPAREADVTSAAPTQGVPRFLFVMLAGYASAVTIALIWLWWTRGRVHPLESLPDVKPWSQYHIIDEAAPLAPKHTLRLGETRRFGDVEITPLRVTLGPAMLVSLSAEKREDADNAKSTFPLLKLWLRIRNVSDDQAFRPFGRELLRLPGGTRHDRFNTFVCRTDQQRENGERVLVYHLWQEERDLALQGQQVDRELAPHETYQTYIASSDQGIDELKGDLVWRVHFRKGLNPKTGRGVTTLIDVAFHSDNIQDESPELPDIVE